jgi:hypothetical protein
LFLASDDSSFVNGSEICVDVPSYHVFRCIHHRRTPTAVVAHVAPAPLVATMPWGDISVTNFTSGSLTIRGGSAVPGSAFYQRDIHISSKVSTAR